MSNKAAKKSDVAESVEYIGFIRYEGLSLEHGYFDARKSAKALLGFDNTLRYFVAQQDQELAKSDYPIPVRIRAGSWEALIPQNIDEWIRTAAGLALSTYLATMAKKLAENDWQDMTIPLLFKKAMQAMQWVLRIGKHMGTLSRRTFNDVRWRKNNTEMGLLNDQGKYLYVPNWVIALFEKMPIHLLKDIASQVTDEIRLRVIVREGNEDTEETLELPDKGIFCPDEAEIPFPELADGMEVTLEGLVTRGNGSTNTVGFLYEGHILTCYPKEGDVARYKPALFLTSKMVGTVIREGKRSDGTELKPKIAFSSLVPLENSRSEPLSPGLFDDDAE